MEQILKWAILQSRGELLLISYATKPIQVSLSNPSKGVPLQEMRYYLPIILKLMNGTSVLSQRKTMKAVPDSMTPKGSSGQRWGVVIGINAYEKVTPLNYAVNDAKVRQKKVTCPWGSIRWSRLKMKWPPRLA